jgi:hypothetical protein
LSFAANNKKWCKVNWFEPRLIFNLPVNLTLITTFWNIKSFMMLLTRMTVNVTVKLRSNAKMWSNFCRELCAVVRIKLELYCRCHVNCKARVAVFFCIVEHSGSTTMGKKKANWHKTRNGTSQQSFNINLFINYAPGPSVRDSFRLHVIIADQRRLFW